jgi:hypothetical protein
MKGNFHVRFLGGKGGAIRPTQPAREAERSSFDRFDFPGNKILQKRKNRPVKRLKRLRHEK